LKKGCGKDDESEVNRYHCAEDIGTPDTPSQSPGKQINISTSSDQCQCQWLTLQKPVYNPQGQDEKSRPTTPILAHVSPPSNHYKHIERPCVIQTKTIPPRLSNRLKPWLSEGLQMPPTPPPELGMLPSPSAPPVGIISCIRRPQYEMVI
jgi:hypothetical protein